MFSRAAKNGMCWVLYWILAKYVLKGERLEIITMGILGYTRVSITLDHIEPSTCVEDDHLLWVKDVMLNFIISYALCTSSLHKVKFSVTLSIVVTCHCKDQFNFTAFGALFIPICCHSTTQHNSLIECSYVPCGLLRLSQ